MAHEFESGLFVGEPAWHRLGVVLEQPPSIDDAIRLAGLDWEVRLAPLALAEDGRAVSHRATVRGSDNAILGVVGPGYVPLQNRDAFGWFQPFVDSGAATLEAAGSLRGGRRVWVLARVADAIREVAPNDPITQYVLLAHAHDGTLAIRCGFTVVRVVCQNTLSGALDDDQSKLLKIRHRSGARAAPSTWASSSPGRHEPPARVWRRVWRNCRRPTGSENRRGARPGGARIGYHEGLRAAQGRPD